MTGNDLNFRVENVSGTELFQMLVDRWRTGSALVPFDNEDPEMFMSLEFKTLNGAQHQFLLPAESLTDLAIDFLAFVQKQKASKRQSEGS